MDIYKQTAFKGDMGPCKGYIKLHLLRLGGPWVFTNRVVSRVSMLIVIIRLQPS